MYMYVYMQTNPTVGEKELHGSNDTMLIFLAMFQHTRNRILTDFDIRHIHGPAGFSAPIIVATFCLACSMLSLAFLPVQTREWRST